MGAGWIIRAAAILLAIAVIATLQGAVGEGAWHHAALSQLSAAIAIAFAPLETHVMDPVRAWLGTQGLQLGAALYAPQSSILLFLLFLALEEVSPARTPSARVVRIAWSALAALLAGFLVGTLALSDPRLPWAMLAALAFWAAGIQSSAPGAGMSALPVMLGCALLSFMAAGIVPVHFSLAPASAGTGVTGTGWVLAWLSVGLMGLGTLGGRDMPQGLHAWICDPAARAGLSILAVLAGSVAIQGL